jgi:hypothetical protein
VRQALAAPPAPKRGKAGASSPRGANSTNGERRGNGRRKRPHRAADSAAIAEVDDHRKRRLMERAAVEHRRAGGPLSASSLIWVMA